MTQPPSIPPLPDLAPLDPIGQVLLVEDDPIQAEFFQTLLEAAGLQVTVVTSGEDAIKQLRWLPHLDCVVSDIMLPGMNGLELLRTSKLIRPLLPVLIMTSHDGAEFPLEALRGGADDMVIKSSIGVELTARVISLIIAGREAVSSAATTVLAIGAHPDDVEIGVGGTLLKHIARKDRIIYLILSDGEHGGIASTRAQEAATAAERFGAVFISGHLKDTVIDDASARSIIGPAIRQYRPSIVYTHTSNDVHQDHRTCHYATLVEARGVPNVYCYQSPSTTIDFRPTHFVDISAELEQKVELIKIFQTQVSIRLYLADDMIMSTSRYWGRFAGHRLVEPFEVVRQSASF